jgi:hypothetical protein
MCEYISLVVSPDARTIHVGDLYSHSTTREMCGLKTDYGQELEWTKDDAGESLTVRVPKTGRRDSEWYCQRILRLFPRRRDLEKWCYQALTDRAVKSGIGKSVHIADSPAMHLLRHVWNHNGHQQGKSWERVNGGMQGALSLAIASHLEFAKDDFTMISENFNSGYWIGSDGGERYYSRACDCNNMSACLSFEAWSGRTPFIIQDDPRYKTTKARICVGKQFYWFDKSDKLTYVTCTSFAGGQKSLTACSYQAIKGDSSHRRKIKSRYTITHDDIKAFHKKIKDLKQAAKGAA